MLENCVLGGGRSLVAYVVPLASLRPGRGAVAGGGQMLHGKSQNVVDRGEDLAAVLWDGGWDLEVDIPTQGMASCSLANMDLLSPEN